MVEDDSQVYFISDLLEELTLIMSTIWWLQKLGRLLVSKLATQVFDMERFNLRNLNYAGVKKWYLFKFIKWFVDLENWMIMWVFILYVWVSYDSARKLGLFP
jgi:hypothetical protein